MRLYLKKYNYFKLRASNYFYQDGVVSYTTGADDEKTFQYLLDVQGNVVAAEEKSELANYYLYHQDIQGSTTSIFDQSGAVETVYDYDDYGETIINGNSSIKNEVCYTGGIYDLTIGLYYLNARYYDPENGRFLTEDSFRGELKDSATLHLYKYCKNNPINHYDPSGHWVISIGMKFDVIFIAGPTYSMAVNFSKKGISITESLGVTFSTNVRWGWSVYASMLFVDKLSDMGGLGYESSATFTFFRFGVTVGAAISDKGKPSFLFGGSIDTKKSIEKFGYYVNLSVGKTAILYSSLQNKVGKKQKQ